MRQTLQAPGPNDWVRHEVAASWLRCLDEYHLRFSSPPQRGNSMPHPGLAADVSPELTSLSAMVEQQSRAFIGQAGLTLCLNAN